MKQFGFIKAACAVPFGKIADCRHNATQIISLIKQASAKNASVVVFPELAITSYTCGELFTNETLIRDARTALFDICNATKHLNILSIVGLPLMHNNKLFNVAAVINKGIILGIVPKSYVPNYKEFYEGRWFTPGLDMPHDTIDLDGYFIPFGTKLLFRDNNDLNAIIGVEICEDLWHVIPPSSHQAQAGATVLCNLSASNALIAKDDYRHSMVKNQSAKCIAAYIYCNTGMGESTTDVVFDASSFIYENGIELSSSEKYLRKDQLFFADIDIERLVLERSRLNTFTSVAGDFITIDFEGPAQHGEFERAVDPHPFVPKDKLLLDERCKEILNIQSSALCKRLETLNGSKVVIGLSGGLDSTLALLVVLKAFDTLKLNKKNIIALTMPGFGTSDATYKNVLLLCKTLNIPCEQISIKDLSEQVYKLVKHDKNKKDTVYENVQARARTFLLMTRANQENGIVIGTGDLSEIALGFSTYSGDHISMYNVNASVPKTLVKFLIQWQAQQYGGTIKKILDTISVQPISPELLPPNGKQIAQKTEDIIGPYELHDFFLYYFVRYGFTAEKILFLAPHAFGKKYTPVIIKKWLTVFMQRFMQNQWKRDCVPAGPKIGSIDLSPRGSWRMPSEVDWKRFSF